MSKLRATIQEMASQVREAASAAFKYFDLRDAHVYGGIASIGYGLSGISQPAAFAVCGLLLFLIGVRR